MQFGWSESRQAIALDPMRRSWQTQAAASLPRFARSGSVPDLGSSIMNQPSDLALPKDRTITISIIAGPSKGLMHRLTKPRVSLGRSGGGADIEIDDAAVSRLHCAVGVKQDAVRLCDLDSANGTYINDERVRAADLEHLSEFRVGSSLFLVTILPKREMGTR